MEHVTRPNTNKYCHVLRPLLAEEKAALRESLRKDGLLSDMVIDQHGDMLDGHNRLDLCDELKIEPRFRQVTTHDPVNWIKGFQKARRNLNREEMRQLIGEQIAETPGLSDREVARITGADHKTVGNVRSALIADGVVVNAVRFEADGRLARGAVSVSNGEIPHKDQPEASPVPEKEKPAKKLVKPVSMKNGRYEGLLDNIMYHCADDGHYHSLGNICKKLDPDRTLRLSPSQLQPTVRAMMRRKDVHIETRPAAKGQKLYRFYKQEKTIGLSVLKAKFGPIIDDLKEMASKPVSLQTSSRFNAAASMLIQLLRELESE